MEAQKGSVQKRRIEDRRRELAEMSEKPFARTIDDEAMNDRMRERVFWDDPMRRKAEEKAQKGGRRVYRGPMPQPNRFGILPGFRWDGIDRSNG